jgi:hypothetical protein
MTAAEGAYYNVLVNLADLAAPTDAPDAARYRASAWQALQAAEQSALAVRDTVRDSFAGA